MYFIIIACKIKEQTGEEGQRNIEEYIITKKKSLNAGMPQTESNSCRNYYRVQEISQNVL